MPITTLSSRDFNRGIGHAKRAATNGPVIITDRGRPSYALMTYAAWQQQRGPKQSLVEALAMPGLSDIAFEPTRAAVVSKDAGLAG